MKMEAACSSETLVCCAFSFFFHVNSRPSSFDQFNFEDGSVILVRNVGTPLLGCCVTRKDSLPHKEKSVPLYFEGNMKYIYIYIYIYMCVCVCVCVYVLLHSVLFVN